MAVGARPGRVRGQYVRHVTSKSGRAPQRRRGVDGPSHNKPGPSHMAAGPDSPAAAASGASRMPRNPVVTKRSNVSAKFASVPARSPQLPETKWVLPGIQHGGGPSRGNGTPQNVKKPDTPLRGCSGNYRIISTVL
jgi:hypothetical protein